MTIISGFCTKCGQPAGTCQCGSKAEFDEGKLWSFLRNALVEGSDICRFHKAMTYEEYSRRMDAAAHKRTTQLINLLNATRKP